MAMVTLDFAGAPRQCFRQPRRILEARHPREVLAVLQQVEDAAAAGAWVVGFVAYEAAPAFDAALLTLPPAGTLPLAWFGVFDEPADAAPDALTTAPPPELEWRTGTDRDAFDTAIAEIRRRIAAGDVYQVNYSLRFHAACDVAAATLYDALAGARHGRYHALIDAGDWAVISLSPELFFDIGADRAITARPMKGTHRRGRWYDEDRAAAETLHASPKDRAENLMIVDLLRNDLGRVAEFGSVHVPRLFAVETYPTVHQLTSTITAQLRTDVTLCDVFAATFPCGSITGAPKFTAMRAIAELETEPRGAYCGAVGVVRPDGSATFNVAIRTITLARGRAVYGAGGGITWDSRADAEYDEVVTKAGLLLESLPTFELLETMRLENGVVFREQRHLQRLRLSAAYWDFATNTADQARAALARVAAQRSTGAWRLRLTAARDGSVDIACSELDAPFVALQARRALHQPAELPRVRLARSACPAQNRLLFHKTTARDLYDSRRADFADAFDVLLYNDEGMVTEFTFGNIVALLDGRLITPPLTHGLLAGAYRQELLDDGTITEAPLSLAQLRTAERLYHINSVRGATEVRLELPAR
jgi:para-aminobenzoate synthetase / 4-amino-4-deoxychorismate lyase